MLVSCIAALHSEPCSGREVADFVLLSSVRSSPAWCVTSTPRGRASAVALCCSASRELGGGQQSGQDLHLSRCCFLSCGPPSSCESWRRACGRVSGRWREAACKRGLRLGSGTLGGEFVCACVGALVTLLPGRAQWHSGAPIAGVAHAEHLVDLDSA